MFFPHLASERRMLEKFIINYWLLGFMRDQSLLGDVNRRIFSKKRGKRLGDFFGLLSEDEGKQMVKDLEKIRMN